MTHKEMIMDYEQNILDTCGFNKDELTDEQIEIIFQPDWGPENFYQDGEIKPDEAKRLWVYELRALGVYNKKLVKYMLE